MAISAIALLARADGDRMPAAHVPRWKWIPFESAPGYVDGAAMVFDVAHGRSVIVGDFFDGGGNRLPTTWQLTGATWDDGQGPQAPRRAFHAMAYDAARSTVVLHGGTSAGPVDFGGGVAAEADTWELTAGSWSQRCAACGPGGLAGHVMAYDAARAETVLFGGGTTWTWNGTAWTKKCPLAPATSCGPPALVEAAMVHDRARGVTVLFGGGVQGAPAGAAAGTAATWEWNGTSWSLRCGAGSLPACGPPPRVGAAMVYDPHRQRTILWSGRDHALYYEAWILGDYGYRDLADTWEWDGTSWRLFCGDVLASAPCEPPGRPNAAVAFDTLERRLVGFGGHNRRGTGQVFYGELETFRAYAEPCTKSATCGESHCDRCDTDHCIDGVCSESYPCSDPCMACDTHGDPGHCAVVRSADDPECSGTCDAAGKCIPKKLGDRCARAEECVSRVCADGVCCDRACGSESCEGCAVALGAAKNGTCGPLRVGSPGRPPCGTFVCDGTSTSCPSRCTSDLECAAGRSCGIDGTCGAPSACHGHVLAIGDMTRDCSPYVCQGGGCKTSCTSVGDCVTPSVCTADHVCGPPSAALTEDGGGCSTAASRGKRDASMVFLAAALLTLSVQRRRRRR